MPETPRENRMRPEAHSIRTGEFLRKMAFPYGSRSEVCRLQALPGGVPRRGLLQTGKDLFYSITPPQKVKSPAHFSREITGMAAGKFADLFNFFDSVLIF